MCQHGVDADEEAGGDFLVGGATHDAGNDFAFAFAQWAASGGLRVDGFGGFSIAACCGRIPPQLFLEAVYSGHEEPVLHFAVLPQIGLAVEDVEKHGTEAVGTPAAGGIVPDDDVLQLL